LEEGEVRGVRREHLVEQRLGLVEVEARRDRRLEQERVQRGLAVAGERSVDDVLLEVVVAPQVSGEGLPR